MATAAKRTSKPQVVKAGAKTRRVRCDSPEGKKAAFAAAEALPKLEVPPYINLPDRAYPFYQSILRAKSLAEWGVVQVTIAAQLARVQLSIEDDWALIATGDRELMEKAGYPSVRAIKQNIDSSTATQSKLLLSLRIDKGLIAGDPSTMDLLKQRSAEREAEHIISKSAKNSKSSPANEPSLLA